MKPEKYIALAWLMLSIVSPGFAQESLRASDWTSQLQTGAAEFIEAGKALRERVDGERKEIALAAQQSPSSQGDRLAQEALSMYKHAVLLDSQFMQDALARKYPISFWYSLSVSDVLDSLVKPSKSSSLSWGIHVGPQITFPDMKLHHGQTIGWAEESEAGGSLTHAVDDSLRNDPRAVRLEHVSGDLACAKRDLKTLLRKLKEFKVGPEHQEWATATASAIEGLLREIDSVQGLTGKVYVAN